MSKLRISVVLAVVAAFGVVSVSAARDVTPEEALVDLAHSRVAAIESVRLYHAGLPEEAHQVALDGYLNHFESVELAVRGVDLGLMITTELAFVRLRASIGNAGSAGDVDQLAVKVLEGFDRIERALSGPGIDAFAVAALLAAAASLIVVYLLALALRLVQRRATPGHAVLRLGALAGLAVISIPAAGHATRTLQTMNLLPTTFTGTPDLSAYVAPLLGLHPTLETLLGQALLLSAWVSVAVVLAPRWIRARR